MKQTILAVLCCIIIFPAHAQENGPIKVGFLYSYTAIPAELRLARQAAELAVEEFNNAGGVQGRPVELLIRDDRGTPSDGVQVAQDLINRDRVAMLIGPSGTSISKAIYELAKKEQIPYFATWCSSNVCVKTEKPYVISFEEPYDTTARNIARHAAEYNIQRWAIITGPDAWSQTLSHNFKEKLISLRPETDIVAYLESPFGKANGTLITQTLNAKKAEGVFLTLVGSDLPEYIRAARNLGLLQSVKHVHPYLPPERIRLLGEEAPENWYIGGYPGQQLKTEESLRFIKNYQARYDEKPGHVGALTYASMKMALASLKKAGSTKAQDIINAALILEVTTPLGTLHIDPETFRANTHLWSGYLKIEGGKPVMVDFTKNTEMP